MDIGVNFEVPIDISLLNQAMDYLEQLFGGSKDILICIRDEQDFGYLVNKGLSAQDAIETLEEISLDNDY